MRDDSNPDLEAVSPETDRTDHDSYKKHTTQWHVREESGVGSEDELTSKRPKM